MRPRNLFFAVGLSGLIFQAASQPASAPGFVPAQPALNAEQVKAIADAIAKYLAEPGATENRDNDEARFQRAAAVCRAADSTPEKRAEGREQLAKLRKKLYTQMEAALTASKKDEPASLLWERIREEEKTCAPPLAVSAAPKIYVLEVPKPKLGLGGRLIEVDPSLLDRKDLSVQRNNQMQR